MLEKHSAFELYFPRLSPLSLLSFYCFDKNQDQHKLGEKGFISICNLTSNSITEKIPRQKLKQSRKLKAEAFTQTIERTAYWLALLSLLRLFSYSTQNHQPGGGALPIMNWALPH